MHISISTHVFSTYINIMLIWYLAIKWWQPWSRKFIGSWGALFSNKNVSGAISRSTKFGHPLKEPHNSHIILTPPQCPTKTAVSNLQKIVKHQNKTWRIRIFYQPSFRPAATARGVPLTVAHGDHFQHRYHCRCRLLARRPTHHKAHSTMWPILGVAVEAVPCLWLKLFDSIRSNASQEKKASK